MIPHEPFEAGGLEGNLAASLVHALERARLRLKCPRLGAEICGMDRATSRELNRRYRGKRGVAEVLSFALPGGAPGGSAGEILLCPPEAEKRARRMGVPPLKWMEELAIHSYLHLLGYRHDDGESARLMFSVQRALVRGR